MKNMSEKYLAILNDLHNGIGGHSHEDYLECLKRLDREHTELHNAFQCYRSKVSIELLQMVSRLDGI